MFFFFFFFFFFFIFCDRLVLYIPVISRSQWRRCCAMTNDISFRTNANDLAVFPF